MQIQSLHIQSYRSFKANDTLPADAVKRLRVLELFQKLRNEGCSEATALHAIGWSRATYFRWRKCLQREGPSGLRAKSRCPRHTRTPQWTRAQARQVWALRRQFPFMGKQKLRILLEREGIFLSESTIGRMLTQGIRLGRIQPCSFCRGHIRARQRRSFDGHAQRLRRGQRATQAGELVQIDHMALSRDGRSLKEFKAVSPIGKQMVARVYSCATARNATRFLLDLISTLPFPLRSVQVDGGSEFRADFEQACDKLNIPLFVLPPKRPQLNSCVERANDTTRVELWNRYNGEFTAAAANRALARYQRFYHQVRPHQALDLRTPNEYLLTNQG